MLHRPIDTRPGDIAQPKVLGGQLNSLGVSPMDLGCLTTKIS